ncbi:hypothetical protein FEM48_Zijuj05G0178200 [Ziziphus jujuba var. spinosa]|uniref:Uncharacterized protein n=1 Tax=Ziziphus jujuba var. spinosa TaxID=714518 RepID=A0A978VG91_ZIZJJ|nr:hypothetical protein FEM48_Zijuj05G0178200 [Ziziphus jujuba var. spinosa]
MNPSDRPTMNKVKDMLEGEVESLQMPPKPFVCPQVQPVNDEGLKSNSRCSAPASNDDSEEITEIIESWEDHTSQIYFPSWIYDHFKEGNEIEMGDATEDESKIRKKMIIVALWCIQMNPNDRPTMSKVKEMLEGDVESLQMRPKPFVCPQEKPANDEGVKSDSRYSTTASCPDDSEEISQIIESS